MRLPLVISVVSLASLVGCASSQRRAAVSRPDDTSAVFYSSSSEGETTVAEAPAVSGAVAEALAFDPPMTVGEPALALSRESRERSAFVGYEDQTVTSFYIRIDDRDFGGRRDRYERRAIIEKTGAIYR